MRCIERDRYIDVHRHTMEYCLALKRKGMLPFLTT